MRTTPSVLSLATLGVLCGVVPSAGAHGTAAAGDPFVQHVARYAEADAVPTGTMTLALDEGRFWLGGQIANANVLDSSLCDVQAPCPTWTVRLPVDGHRLRIALDTPSREDSFDIELLSSAGAVLHRTSLSNQFDGELFVADPKAGEYRIRVVPKGATNAFFRMRAKLESAPAKEAGARELLPNLKAVPPFEFGFAAPANPLNGAYPPDTVNPPASVAGTDLVSCAPDETAPEAAGGQGATDCLRLTTGPLNVGDGPFVKKFFFAQDLAAGKADPVTLRGPSEQVVYHADGTTTTRPSGTYSFHRTHAHFHDEGILTYEGFRVVGGPDGTVLAPAGVGTKSGFCPADQLFGQWRSFKQAPTGEFSEGDTVAGSCFSPNDGTFSLSKGWGDIYRWQRPGQFVEWAGNPDGYYVIRATVDKGDLTKETDETDNSSYAFIRVVGRRVELIERGQGLSHLDPRKEVFTGFGPASQDPYGGDVPAALGSMVARDTTAPVLRSLALRLGARRTAKAGASVLLRLDEAATVRFTVTRGALRVGTFTAKVAVGRRTLRVPAAVAVQLRRAGRYRLSAVAVDRAGNFARVVRTRAVRVAAAR